DDLLNRPFYTLYTQHDDSIKAEYELNVALKTGKFVTEGWKKRKDGNLIWCELALCPIQENGTTVGFSCLMRDVSERKKGELDLRESEERYRLMVEGVKEYAIFMLDTTGHIVSWNDGAKRLKGYSANEIIGKHFSIFYTAEDLETKKPERELKIAIATGKYEEEGWRIKKNGSLFWANIVITALFNQHNQHIGFSKVTRDLTERKDSEENLRQSEERYRSLVEQLNDYGILMLDEKGRIVSWNEGAKRISGYTAEEIIGKYFSIFYLEEDLINGKPTHELKVAKATGKYEEEGWRLRKDGSRFWSSVVITAVYNAAGAHIGFSKVTRDLTERKEAERALRDSYERYRQLAEE
ncbi:MAG TPA: PAS domain S-box protein, partial [Flavisolibacter sp.]|nr:PAS domain S-box protein [Flavisolibacter sp.]